MDPVRFDTLVKSLAAARTRRGIVRLLSTLSLGMTLTALFDDGPDASAEDDDHGSSHRRHRRKTRNARRSGDDKDNRKGQRKGKRTGCNPESRARTCAGKCATVINNCGKAVDCGPCTCATGCPQCQSCNPATRLCDLVTNGTGCDDGNACTQTDTCQNGVCIGSNPTADGTVCPGGFCCGGECKECCTDQHCPSGFCHGNNVCAPKECTQTSCDVAGGVICGRNAPTNDPCFCYRRADNSGFFCAESRPSTCSGAGTCDAGQTCVAGGGSQCHPDPHCAVECAWPT
jgi:hypothetical protein